MTRAELARKLLETSHLNVPERRQLGLPSIHFSELLAAIRDVVELELRFSSGELTLEKLELGKYRIHRLVQDPAAGSMSYELPVVPVTDDHPSVESAVEAFLGYILGRGGQPPGTIDGIDILGFPIPTIGKNKRDARRLQPGV